MNFQEPFTNLLQRIASALERLSPTPALKPDFRAAEAFIWSPEGGTFQPVSEINRLPIDLLKGIGRMRDTLLANTERFARGLPANNALLWAHAAWEKAHSSKPCTAPWLNAAS